ncbi:YncE family protein [Blastococcus goldschmidtiae]|uniref:YncE family protein n=1 Tax=Blastococcus goldschmidtiae TaxID=3075546 RepID=A0ABU2K631_9ACTN|nr:YncE family protein [Blastococcus sp. DSM 46792]MDT0275627.1 YncE family protein [Blastococcus sp. DSM 46792]
MRRATAPALTAATLAVVLAAAGSTVPAAATGAPADDPRPVMFVGNNWDGTATVVDAATHEPIATVDTIPDRHRRMVEILTRPDALAFHLAITAAIGEGHAQYADDMYTTHDGRLLAVSRPSFADVVGIDLASGDIVWRFPMEGYRSDHMGVSPDGERLLVSDSTANKVHELNIRTGAKTGEFPSGDSPHENNYTADGSRVFHASIGRVYTPVDRPVLRQPFDTLKGEQYFQIVRTDGLAVEQRWDMGRELEEAGYPGMASAVRPMALAPDERYVYLQVSFFHGWIEFDTQAPDADTSRTYDGEPAVGAVTRVVDLPKRTTEPRERYVLDSAHHGLAIDPAGTTLCAAGTMDGYAAIIDRETGEHRLVEVGEKPYWSTTGVDDDECWVSVSGTDQVVVIDYDTAERIATIVVGDHPQRVREGVVADDVLTAWR